jgi:hypothetical protein
MGESKVQGVYKTIQKAVSAADPGTVIKITSNLYEENLIIE